ncbi:MAG: efflux RND transporter permease subunit [Candidatus Marinimicrobia bacterium]|nr:efflux RND transporter permease subunit [Candidatus Neomarinimicrobiota bacterium]
MNLTEFSLRRPITILMIFTCLVVIGAIATQLISIEFFPEVQGPQIWVEIPYPGSTPEEVERQITRPAEEVLGTITGVKRIMSNSRENGAWVQLEFKWGENTAIKALEAQEKLNGIRHLLPEDVERFFVRKWSSSDWAILNLRISSERDLSNAYDMLNRNIKRRLERINGVSRVELYGIEKKQIRVELLADRIKSHNINLNQLSQILTQSNFSVTAGRITDGQHRFVVRPISEFQSVKDFENLIIGAHNLRLKDVANVSYQNPVLDYGRHLDRKYAIGLDVFKESGANTIAVTEAVTAEIDEISRLPEMAGIAIYYMDNQAEGILSSLRELLKSGLLGAFFAVALLFFFLRKFQTTMMVILAVPFSLLVTVALLYFFNLSLNILTMMGLMLSVGMLVDNGVVVTESIYRHRQNDKTEKLVAIKKGVKEVGLAITAGTLTTAIVFLPNIVNSQNEVSMYLKHVGLTIVFALGASLLIAQTVIPLIARHVRLRLSNPKATTVDKMVTSYRRVLVWMIGHHKISLLIVFLVLVSVAIPMKFVSKDMFPPQEDRRIRLRYQINGSYTIEKIEEAVDVIEEYLFANQEDFEIKSVYSYYNTNYAMSTIILTEKESAHKSLDQIKEEIRENLPKLAIAQPSFERRHRQGDGEGVRVQLVGKSSERLVALSHDVAWVLSKIPGFTDVRSQAEAGDEEVQVVIDRDRARQYGFSVRDIARTISVSMRGQNLRKLRAEDGEIDVRVMMQKEDQRTLDNLKDLPLFNDQGQVVRLASLADFKIRRGPRNIFRENRTTIMSVYLDLDDVTMDQARSKIRAVLDNYNFPTGYSYNFGSAFSYEDETMQMMMMNTLLALALIYFVMAALFESLVFPAAIWTSIIFAIVGVFWFFLITGTNFDLMAWTGVLILIGVVVNNGIVLIDYVNQLRSRGRTRTEAILQAGQYRLRPILMTAGTTILGLIPLCFGGTLVGGGGPPYFPMARAIVGGLAFSTFVTLIILPTIYITLDDLRNWSRRVLRLAKIN